MCVNQRNRCFWHIPLFYPQIPRENGELQIRKNGEISFLCVHISFWRKIVFLQKQNIELWKRKQRNASSPLRNT